MFCSDYPRGLSNCFWLRWFPVPLPLPIAVALIGPFLLTRRHLAVSSLCLAGRRLPRCLPAALAAIALPHPPGMKALPIRQRHVRVRRGIRERDVALYCGRRQGRIYSCNFLVKSSTRLATKLTNPKNLRSRKPVH